MYFTAQVTENRVLGLHNFVLELDGCSPLAGAQPGQFVMLRADWGRDPLLPRAFSILRLVGERCQLLIKAAGRATGLLERLQVGAAVALLGPLGKPFPLPQPGDQDLLVAGGVGLAPLLWYAEVARTVGVGTELYYGARSDADLVLVDEIKQTGCPLHLVTEDGSVGAVGRVTDLLATELDQRKGGAATRILTCGPNAMMRAIATLAEQHGLKCLVSVEGEMACGIGACLGCAVPQVADVGGARPARPFAYACVDGPVFDAARIVIP